MEDLKPISFKNVSEKEQYKTNFPKIFLFAIKYKEKTNDSNSKPQTINLYSGNNTNHEFMELYEAGENKPFDKNCFSEIKSEQTSS